MNDEYLSHSEDERPKKKKQWGNPGKNSPQKHKENHFSDAKVTDNDY